MARDYTKYNVSGVGQNLNKRQLVGNVVRHWAAENKPTFNELSNQFPDSIQGSKGFIRKVKDVDDPKRFDLKNPIVLKYKVEACVSNQWGKENVAAFIEHIKGLGYAVEEVSASPADRKASEDSSSGFIVPGVAAPAPEEVVVPEISDEVRALINDAGYYEMDGILAQILGKEEESVTCLDFLPFLMEMISENRFCGAEMSEDFFGQELQIEFVNEKMSEIIAEADDGAAGFGSVSEYKKMWSDLLKVASDPAVAVNFDCHMRIANCVDQSICPFENESDMRALADKHFKLAAEAADGIYELVDVIHACGTGENALNYRNDGLLEECIKRGLDFANSFDDYRKLCFKNEHQLAKGEQFEAALAGCKKGMEAEDFDVEYWADEIKELNDGLERLGMEPFELPDYNIKLLRKMKLPEHLTPEWDLGWGHFVDIRLLNSPDLETDGFHIHLSLATGHILGVPKDNEYSEREYRWFGDEALLYEYNNEEYASSATITLYDRSHISICEATWHDAFEDCDEGELPSSLSEERFNEIFNGKWFSELYHHIKRHLSDEGLEGQLNNLSSSGIDMLTADFMLKTDSGDLICSLKNFVVNMSGANADLQNDYERIKKEGRACASIFASSLIGRTERELYFEFLTRSIPSGSTDRYRPTIDGMQEEGFDWFEITPHIVLTRVGEFDLTPIVCFDEDDESIVKQCSDIFKEWEKEDFNSDDLRDYIDNYESAARFSVDGDLFKAVVEEL